MSSLYHRWRVRDGAWSVFFSHCVDEDHIHVEAFGPQLGDMVVFWHHSRDGLAAMAEAHERIVTTSAERALDRLTEVLVEDVLAMSDEEILQEYQED